MVEALEIHYREMERWCTLGIVMGAPVRLCVWRVDETWRGIERGGGGVMKWKKAERRGAARGVFYFLNVRFAEGEKREERKDVVDVRSKGDVMHETQIIPDSSCCKWTALFVARYSSISPSHFLRILLEMAKVLKGSVCFNFGSKETLKSKSNFNQPKKKRIGKDDSSLYHWFI